MFYRFKFNLKKKSEINKDTLITLKTYPTYKILNTQYISERRNKIYLKSRYTKVNKQRWKTFSKILTYCRMR